MVKRISVLFVLVAVLVGGIFLYSKNKGGKNVKQIQVNGIAEQSTPANSGNVSPISGLACENWNKRPIAVMQPADVQARPAAGFSEADIVFEIPAFTSSVTRLMGVYLCNIPKETGAIRSARHDYLHFAKGLDAVFVHWGYSHFAEGLLNKKLIDNINCLTTSYCERWTPTGKMRMEDTGHIKSEKIIEAMQKYGYHTDNKFVGYPHQNEASEDQRPNGGNLRVAFANPYDVNYEYDKSSNSYKRLWNGEPDTDKNNGTRISPKNVVVMFAKSEQIKLSDNYVARGVEDPWQYVPEDEKVGLDYGGIGRYNNMQVGDPWFDNNDSGDAYYYFNGKEYKGSWKKDRSKMESKLFFYDEQGKEIKFVPGQIWVEILEPGQTLKWEPVA